MPQEKPTKVVIIEAERGWGSRVDEVKMFPTRAAAEKFCRDYNADNNKPTVPDWYMVARIEGD
jgi:hypothetical protein